MNDAVSVWWIRRDLRLADNAALSGAAREGRVIALFLRDASVDGLGAAARWRLGLGLARLDEQLRALGGRIVFLSGEAAEVLPRFVAQVGAGAVHWQRLYDAQAIARDSAVKAALKARGGAAVSHPGHVLFEPWTVSTGQGAHYKVYSPFWRAVKDRDVPAPVPVPALRFAVGAPAGEALGDWALGAAMRRGAAVVGAYAHAGEAAAQKRLTEFIESRVDRYRARRDFPAEPATSGLSENLTYGEISPRTVWHAGRRAMEQGARGAEHFLKELAWREFAWHLMYHEPDLDRVNHRAGWDGFAWRGDNPEVERWRRGLTGEPFVDAAMREMYVTGTMHNRARMIVASYLTKHLLTDWRVGRAWFEDCLIDWDPAANAMGWQWVAGCGPDAAPYFRVFNPRLQAEKFDPDGAYRRCWIAEGHAAPPRTALSYFDAVPRAWGLDPGAAYPAPIVTLAEGRARALAAYAGHGG